MPKKGIRGVETTSQNNDNKRRRLTQEERVLNHLRDFGSITSMQAFRLYDMTRLSAVIFNLREDGYDIPMTWEVSKSGKRYGRYFMREVES